MLKLYRRRLRQLQHRCVRQVSRLLANSSFTQDRIREIFGVEAPVCRYGVDLNQFRPSPAVRRGSHVLSVGELSPRKGFAFLVESLALVPAPERPTLRIACNSEIPQERRYVEQLAKARNVSLEIRSKLNTDELAREYRQAALCVYAPIDEPFGLVPLEAMACGTAVVGVREGGVAESVVHEQTGLLVRRDLRAFADATRYLLSASEVRAEYGWNGREHVVAHWSWDRSVADLERHLAYVADCERRERGTSRANDIEAVAIPDERTIG